MRSEQSARCEMIANDGCPVEDLEQTEYSRAKRSLSCEEGGEALIESIEVSCLESSTKRSGLAIIGQRVESRQLAGA